MGYVGTYDKTIFYNPSNKYCIISVKTSDQSVPQQARNAFRHRDNMIRFTAVGYELPQTDKVSMILDGEWENGKYGIQLQVEKCEEIVPQTKEGVYGYLSSRLIKGVGEKTAALIVNRFGADALRVLENEPERLLEIRGITPDKLEDIKTSYAESRCVRDLMILLTPFNVTATTATKIYEHFGSRSVDILQKNPYELCQVSGFGFKRVDAIVRKGDLPLDAPIRIHGAVFAALDTQRNEKGHLFLDETALAKTSVKLLNENTTDGQIKVTPAEVDAVIQNMILSGEIVSSNGNIYQIAKLIAGLWDVKGGNIIIGGVDIRSITQADYNRYIAYVSQDNYLFDTTVMENIRMGNQTATDEEVIEAAKNSGCHEFILSLENGYQTVVGGAGGHLSGGERQRIAIARAMLKNAPIIILDEATAFTDPENEALIQSSVAKLTKGKTLIVIAHRLSTITNSDQIFVVEDGNIRASGTHEELLKKDSLYTQMWRSHIAVKDTAEGGAEE